MNIKRWIGSVVVTLSMVAGVGCSSSEAPPRAPEAARLIEAPALVAAAAVKVDDAIARACDLPSAHFEYDSAAVHGSADPYLDKVAACFTSGPLAGRKVNLVGHADPRGETHYNLALGQRRAGNVASAIVARGVQSNQVATTSRGEIDAVGQDEAGWARDRRVDMVLAD